MKSIWNLSPIETTQLLLWRIDAKSFRVVQFDKPVSLLTNHDYVLMDKKFNKVLEKLTTQIQNREVIIHDKVRNATLDNYIELEIANEISPASIDKMDDKGLKIWRYGDYVFVSDELKTELENIGSQDFEFTQGFSQFAGTVTDGR